MEENLSYWGVAVSQQLTRGGMRDSDLSQGTIYRWQAEKLWRKR